MIDTAQIRERLKEVIDPELNVNIVDLGLIYDISVSDEGDAAIRMTLTTPGCPLHATMVAGVKAALSGEPGLRSIAVEVVWSPPWTPGMMSEAARNRLGIA